MCIFRPLAVDVTQLQQKRAVIQTTLSSGLLQEPVERNGLIEVSSLRPYSDFVSLWILSCISCSHFSRRMVSEGWSWAHIPGTLWSLPPSPLHTQDDSQCKVLGPCSSGVAEAGLQQGLSWVNCLVHFPTRKMELNLHLAASSASDGCAPSLLPFSAGCQCYTWPKLPARVLLLESSELFRQFSSKSWPFLIKSQP